MVHVLAVVVATAVSLMSPPTPIPLDIDAVDVVVLGIASTLTAVGHGVVLWVIRWFGWDAD